MHFVKQFLLRELRKSIFYNYGMFYLPSPLYAITSICSVQLFKNEKTCGHVSGAHGFNVKSVSPAYIAHFLVQDLSHILHVFLVGVLLFTPHSTNILCITTI